MTQTTPCLFWEIIESLGTSSNEGGQISLAPATSSSYTNNIYLDNYQDKFRIFMGEDNMPKKEVFLIDETGNAMFKGGTRV